MTIEQRTAHVKQLQEQRAEIQKNINSLNAERVKFVAEKQKELAQASGEATLDAALIDAIHEQANAKAYSFGK